MVLITARCCIERLGLALAIYSYGGTPMASTATPGARSGTQSWLRPLTQDSLDQREGAASAHERFLNQVAERLGVDEAFACTLREYLLARQRLHLGRAGWRASFRPRN